VRRISLAIPVLAVMGSLPTGAEMFGQAFQRSDRIREAVSPSLSRLCRRKLAAGLARAIVSRITAVMLVHLFETRVEAETWVTGW